MAKRRGKKPKHWKEVLLCRHKGPKRLGSLRRAFLEYRAEHGLPYRCDIENCQFHNPDLGHFQDGKPFWLNAEVPLVVDHIRANTRDNRPENLRLVCPNCAFQLPTHGGHNKNTRIQEDAWGYIWKTPGGKVNCVYFASGGLKVGGSASAKVDVVRVMQDR